ncbi:MAG: hypothetical protein SFY80_17100 [Verrucomicrobiota bacterium]|nr:hypothetical protein [Verrucomicrobiota bacterium]
MNSRVGILWIRLGRRIAIMVVTIAVLYGAGWLLSPLEQRAWQPELVGWPTLKASETRALTEQGVLLGLVGGLRALTANIIWLQSSLSWEEHDIAATDRGMQLALIVDSRPFLNWRNAAMIMAFDIPHWRIAELSATLPNRDQLVREIRHVQGARALALLERGKVYHPNNCELYALAALIHHQVLDDEERAASIYGYASTLPNAPYYLARIRGELLREMGKYDEAYAWYRAVYESLPNGDPAAQKHIVLQRLRSLETVLNLPEYKRLPKQQGQ